MDVRQFAFLARQPSAVLKSRSNFLGLPKRGLALVLANAMFWQPLLAQADGIAVSGPGTTLGQAGNGVPIVNIAAPNGNGLSHNQFQDYNVGTNGVILNNATGRTQSTQLGGIIVGNPNLKGSAATVILNEVNGGSPSQLRGYTEVAGQSAHVIVANPYGITCNGCGFINTPQATLTTGKAVINNGQVTGYQVDQGSVSIEGAGLNANNIDSFEIIARSAKLNAEIQARNLTIIAGANDVDANTLKATARAADPATKPQLAIDSSALGGMYAGAIKLVSSEAGVGVKLDGKMAASGGDMQLDINGHLSLVDTSAAGAVNVKADSLEAKGPVYAATTLEVKTQGDLTSQNNLVAKDRITLTSGGQLTNHGIIEAGVNADNTRNATGDVSISAQNLNNTGNSVIASRNLAVGVAQVLTNQGGTLSAQTSSLNAGTLDNQNKGRVLGDSTLNLTADQVLNTQGVITSNGNLTANAGYLNNHAGEVSSAGNTRVTATTLDNSDGQLTGDVALNIGLIGALNNRNGVLGSGERVSISAASLDNSQNGSLVSDGSLAAQITGLLDNQSGDLTAKGLVDLQTSSLDNRNGRLTGTDRLSLRSAAVDNRMGKVRATGDLQLDVQQLDNRQQGLLSSQAAVNFNGAQLDNRGGLLSATGPLRIDASRVDNSGGRISSKTDLVGQVGQFTNQGGELVAQGTLTLSGNGLDNQGGGLVGATNALKLNVDELDNRGGEISSTVDVAIEGQRLNNSDGGKVLAGTALGLKVAQIINQSQGQLFSKGATQVTGQRLDNSGGSLVTQQGLDIRLDNALSNLQGLISVDGTLTVNAQSLDNSQKGQISSKGATLITTGAFDNTLGGQLISSDTLELTAAQVSNGLASRIASDKALTASVSGFDQQGGQLFSKTSLSLDLNQGQLNNQNGVINAPLLMLKNLKNVNNQSGEISSAQAFTLLANTLDNSNGKLISNQGLTLRVDQQLTSVKGLIAGQTLDVRSALLDNTAGLISSRGTLGVTVDGQVVNQDGTLIADGNLQLSADSVDNRRGQIAGKADVSTNVATVNNQGGQLIATGGLTLTGTQLDNRNGGLVGANTALNANIGAIDNRGGELSSASDVSLAGNRLDNSDGGQVIAQGALALTVDHVINRAKGELSGKADLTLSGQDLDNSGGSLLSQKNLKAALSGDLTNSQGLLSAEAALGVTAANLTNTSGSLSAAGPLTVTATGAVLNQGGEIVTDAGIALNSAGLDNSNNGSISGKGAVSVNTGALDNSHNGRLNSGTTLDLTTTQLTNQDGGRIASSGALTASVTGMDQQGGQLFSNTALTLDVNQGQLNNQNGLISAPLLMLKNLADINNNGGEISSAQAFNVTARSLDNSNGKLLSNQALTLRVDQALTNLKGLIAAAALDVKAARLDNSGGTLTSRANLDVNLDGLLTNQNTGLINATTGLTINSRGINNQSGSLLGSAIAIDFAAATADLDNSGGLITTAGVLSIQHLRDLSNRNGEISSTQRIDLSARALDNSGAKLISNDVLTVNADTVQNLGGLLSGWQGLSLTSNGLDNRNKGTLSSRDGAVSVAVSGAVLNSGEGAIVSRKNLDLSAASLDNSNGGVVSSGGAQALTLSGLLTNAQGGLIDSGAGLVIQAMTLGNASGTVNAQQDLSFTGTTLDNTAGNLVGNAAVTLDLLGVLTNTNGKLASVGPLRVQRSTQIDNQGGQLASQGLLTLLSGGLDNRNRGTVAANDLLTISTPGALQNSSDGLIYSQAGDLNIQAGNLANAKGTLQSQGALSVVTGGDIDNQSGRIIAKAGDLSINGNTLDNRGGVLSSLQAAFNTHLTGVLKNGYDLNNNRQGGVTQAQRLNLTALGGIDNYGGRVSAQSGDAIISTGNFDNRNGGVYAKGKINVTGNNFDNSGNNDGQIAGQQIDLNLSGALNNRLGIIESDTTLAIQAASLDNQTGQLRALGSSGKTDFQLGGLFDNRNGTLESANTDLGLAAGSFLNDGGSLLHVGNGTFDIATANVTGAGGSIVTRGGLTLNADSWSNSNVIQAARLNVNVNNFSQTASGRLSSLATLGLSAGQVSLNAASTLAGGGDTTVAVAGQLNNAGRLTSATNLTVSAGAINNQGTLGSGQALTVTTGTLVNDRGLIFSGGNMGLRVNTLNNNYANIYSLGNLTIDRDGQGAQASSIINTSASIQSDGSMSLSASTLQNVRDVLTINNAGIYTARIGEVTCIEGYNAGDCSGKQNHVWEIVQREKLEVTAASAASSITAGGDLSLNGGDLLNQSSTIATGGKLSATLVNLTNSGVETGETERTRIYMSERTRNAGGWYNAASAFTNQYWYESAGYNAANLGGLQAGMANFIGMTETELVGLGSTRKLASGDQSYAAIIQAAGAVNVNAQNTIGNGAVRPGYTYVGSGPRTGTGASDSTFSTRISLNQQLPPNLSQQQVNPLALPGFALPTGQNGLFRLSAQNSSAPVIASAQSWTMGSAAINPDQRQQTLPTAQSRNIQLGNAAQASASNVDLSATDRQAPSVGAGASAINVSQPAASAEGSALPGRSTAFTVNRVQGLPASSGQSKPQKYLIETNPVLTDLKQFMSSDYLLSSLGYDPDQSAKRLGDGFYEQTLIQQAVVARTGQRYIDGQTSDESLFKYLMNNAVASKQALNLSLGVSLTSEQVAALTHDIVWMENAEVNGEQVLVPVLYLANANNRLAANGALIQGSDVTLIAGKDLNNAGTLKATNNLSATAGSDLVNTGLVDAGNRLDLLAGNNLINKAGGIIAGRDVSLTAGRDVINERTVTTHESSSGYRTERTDFVDNAARVEAANGLTINAGRDINNTASVLKSGADTTISAGRDVNLVAAEQITRGVRGLHTDQTITQYGSTVDAGHDLKVSAGRDVTAIASQIDAKRDVSMSAVGDLTLASAADEQHSYSKSKKVTTQEDHVKQVASNVTAGGDVVFSAGKDMTLVSSRINAGDEAYLVAGGKLDLLAAQDRDYSLYDKKKKGSFGKLQTRHDEVTQVTNVGSEIKTGGDLTLKSGDDQRYQVAKLESGKNLTLDSGGSITFEGVKDLHDESHTKTNNNAFWNSSKGKGQTDETLRQSQLTAAGAITIKAVEGLKIDVKQVNQQTVSQTIDAMVKADPKLAWLQEAEKRGDVDWRQVKEIHESFKYNTSGLGPASQLIIAIALAAVMGPMMAGWNSMAQAGALSVATKATVSTIDNRGNLGAILKDVTSKDSLKGYAVSVATAGVAQGLNYSPGAMGFDLQSAQTVALKVTADAVIKTAVYGGSFQDNLASSAMGTAASIGGAIGAGKIGDQGLPEGGLEKILLHAGLGGLLSKAMGGDFRTGAIAGGANEVLVGLLGDKLLPENLVKGSPEYIRAEANLMALSQIAGVLGAVASGGDAAIASTVAANATQYNFLGNHSQAVRDRARQEFEETGSLDAARKLSTLEGADHRSDDLLAKLHNDPSSLSAAETSELKAYLQVYAYEQQLKYGSEVAASSVKMLVENGPVPIRDYGYAGTTESKIAYADALRAVDGVSVLNPFWSREQTANEMVYRDAQGYLRISNEQQGLSNIGTPALYVMSGPLGSAIRIAAAANGVLQAGYGAQQVIDGDTWNGLGNIVIGAMGAASVKIPGVRIGVASNEVKGVVASELGELANAGKGAINGPASAGEKGFIVVSTPAGDVKLPDWYRVDGAAGADFVSFDNALSDGAKRIINTRTGNFEVLGADGLVYFNGPNGLVPKAGGNLAVLAEAERGIVGAKEAGSVSAGPKIPPKLQPLSNPPQGPVIPPGWVSRPGKTQGSTIYYPPGSDPSAPGSTYIRLMPSGSTPVPGLENGYWISVKNGQPINPATGGTGARGDTHVPLPPNTVPPKR